MSNRFSLVFVSALFILLTGCKKNKADKEYFVEFAIEGKVIRDTWKQGQPSDVHMGASYYDYIGGGVERRKCDQPNSTCYRFSFQVSDHNTGKYDPIRLIIEDQSKPQDYHYYRGRADGDMVININKFTAPSGPADFGEVSGMFKGKMYKGPANASQLVFVAVEGSFRIPTIP